MTYGEAIKIIKEDALYNPEAAEIAIKAIQKQIPVHPQQQNVAVQCPVCGRQVKRMYGFCPKCGKKLDWSMVIRGESLYVR